MHDTAYEIGTLAMSIYADLSTASILEIGSHSVNGSLRRNALPSTNYVGVDLEEGEGVDVVVEPGKPLPVDEDSFDLVMATSVFEHDPFFWLTFLEMCRAAKDGAYIYVNAPSNGVVHRYPEDNWRFYPDSGRALTQWAVSQGQHITLVESFTAGRQNDIWNDFVAVFRKGRVTKTLPKVFLHEHFPCSNILTWRSDEVINPTNVPEDLVLLQESSDRAKLAEEALARTTEELTRISADAEVLAAKLEQAEKMRDELRLRENELIQRQEEIEQTRSELAQARADRDALKGELASLKVLLEQEQALVAATVADKEIIAQHLDELERDFRVVERRLEQSEGANDNLQARLQARFKEIAMLTRMLVDHEEREQQSREEADWLRAASSVLLMDSTTPKTRLRRLLPAAFYYKRQQKMLKERGLFDADVYLAAHPDVAAGGTDALRHYLYHGIGEKRRRG